MTEIKKIFIAIFLLSLGLLNAQSDRTVGLITYDSLSYDAYTLFSPMTSRTTYLINNCGEKVHEWTFESPPGLSAYLQEDGTITRAGMFSGSFGAGGAGGSIVKKNWNDEILWSFIYSNDDVRQHHDFQVLPNGNVLLLAWEQKTKEEAVEAGRISSLTNGNGVWFEHLIEVKPIGVDSSEIVWEWHVLDHLVQDRDSSTANYGSISNSVRKINVNYKIEHPFSPGNPGLQDWMHMNSVQYHPGRDEIILSARNQNEIYIIDHSTTTEEAATDKGGKSGKGGDFLFRWGNTEAYNKGTEDDLFLHSQHHASWIDKSDSKNASFTIFNNGLNRPEGNFSSIEFVYPSLQNNNYVLSSDSIFLTDNVFTITDVDKYNFTSSRLSGAQVLENENILITSGNNGRIIELTPSMELVWEYVSPVSSFEILEQGEVARSNDIFRSIKYPIDYPAFDDKELMSRGTIELDTMPLGCMVDDSIMSNNNVLPIDDINIFPNPTSSILNIDTPHIGELNIKLYSIDGQLMAELDFIHKAEINLDLFESGFYILKVESKNKVHVSKIIKN